MTQKDIDKLIDDTLAEFLPGMNTDYDLTFIPDPFKTCKEQIESFADILKYRFDQKINPEKYIVILSLDDKGDKND